MKTALKKFSLPIFISVSSFLITINSALAYDYKQAAQDMANGSPIQSPDDIFTIMSKVVKYVYTAFFIVAVLMVLMAAYTFLRSDGEPGKIKTATAQIKWAAVAIAIALISVGAAAIINNFLSVK